LTGSKASGDAYALAALETIAEDAGFPSECHAAKRRLFGVFLAVWSRAPADRLPDDEPATVIARSADRSLQALTPRLRAAFLLHAVEGFGTEEIATMLACSISEVEALQERAGLEMAAQFRADVPIIEDKPVIAMDLEALVNGLGHRMTGVARTRTDAVAAVQAIVGQALLFDRRASLIAG